MKNSIQQRPTMTDIATMAGVSQSTVSLVLNNATGAKFSDVTRKKVWKAARTLGYQIAQRGPAAGSELATQAENKNLIVYIADEISTSPHPVVNIDGARDAAYAAGRMLAVFATSGDSAIERQVLASVRANPDVLGIIYATVYTRKVTLPREDLGDLPTVLLNCYADDSTYASVVPAEVTGGHLATDYLLKSGHRRIGMVNGEPWQDAAQDRLKGYRMALTSADLPYAPELVRHGDWSSGAGFEQTLSLMREPRPPTAIFCANDLMALGAIEALKQLGLRVPEDVSILGYDDQEIARHTHPALSTVVLPNYELGRWAVETLLRDAQSRATGLPVRQGMVKLDGPLVERASVRVITVAETQEINNISA